jgi:preprotein translocase subunit Sec63
MSRYELIVSLACLVVGYLAVSWLLNRSLPPGDAGQAAGRPRGAGAAPGAMPWYVVLDVDRSASRAAITAAYRARISQYHPDKVARMGPEIRALAEQKSAEINAAYEAALRNLG